MAAKKSEPGEAPAVDAISQPTTQPTLTAGDDSEVLFVIRLLERSFEEAEPFKALRSQFGHGLSNATDQTLGLIRDAIADTASALMYNNAEGLKLAEAFRYQQLGLVNKKGLIGEGVLICRAYDAVEAAISRHQSPPEPWERGHRNIANDLIGGLTFIEPLFCELRREFVQPLLNQATLGKKGGGKHERGTRATLVKLILKVGAFDVTSEEAAYNSVGDDCDKREEAVKAAIRAADRLVGDALKDRRKGAKTDKKNPRS